MHPIFKNASTEDISDFACKLKQKLANKHKFHIKESKLLHDFAEICGKSNWHAMKNHSDNEHIDCPYSLSRFLENADTKSLTSFIASVAGIEDRTDIIHRRAYQLIKLSAMHHFALNSKSNGKDFLKSFNFNVFLSNHMKASLKLGINEIEEKGKFFLNDLPGYAEEEAILGRLNSKTREHFAQYTMKINPAIEEIIDNYDRVFLGTFSNSGKTYYVLCSFYGDMIQEECASQFSKAFDQYQSKLGIELLPGVYDDSIDDKNYAYTSIIEKTLFF